MCAYQTVRTLIKVACHSFISNEFEHNNMSQVEEFEKTELTVKMELRVTGTHTEGRVISSIAPCVEFVQQAILNMELRVCETDNPNHEFRFPLELHFSGVAGAYWQAVLGPQLETFDKTLAIFSTERRRHEEQEKQAKQAKLLELKKLKQATAAKLETIQLQQKALEQTRQQQQLDLKKQIFDESRRQIEIEVEKMQTKLWEESKRRVDAEVQKMQEEMDQKKKLMEETIQWELSVAEEKIRQEEEELSTTLAAYKQAHEDSLQTKLRQLLQTNRTDASALIKRSLADVLPDTAVAPANEAPASRSAKIQKLFPSPTSPPRRRRNTQNKDDVKKQDAATTLRHLSQSSGGSEDAVILLPDVPVQDTLSSVLVPSPPDGADEISVHQRETQQEKKGRRIHYVLRDDKEDFDDEIPVSEDSSYSPEREDKKTKSSNSGSASGAVERFQLQSPENSLDKNESAPKAVPVELDFDFLAEDFASLVAGHWRSLTRSYTIDPPAKTSKGTLFSLLKMQPFFKKIMPSLEYCWTGGLERPGRGFSKANLLAQLDQLADAKQLAPSFTRLDHAAVGYCVLCNSRGMLTHAFSLSPRRRKHTRCVDAACAEKLSPALLFISAFKNVVSAVQENSPADSQSDDEQTVLFGLKEIPLWLDVVWIQLRRAIENMEAFYALQLGHIVENTQPRHLEEIAF